MTDAVSYQQMGGTRRGGDDVARTGRQRLR